MRKKIGTTQSGSQPESSQLINDQDNSVIPYPGIFLNSQPNTDQSQNSQPQSPEPTIVPVIHPVIPPIVPSIPPVVFPKSNASIGTTKLALGIGGLIFLALLFSSDKKNKK